MIFYSFYRLLIFSQIKVGFECSQSIIKSKCNEEAAKMAEKVALAFMPEQQKVRL